MRNFRQSLIEALAADGYDCTVIANADTVDQSFTGKSLRFIPIKVDSKGINPIKDIGLLEQLKHIYRREQFDFVFHYTIKPVIYGSIAAHQTNIPSLSVITGLGYVFLQNNWLCKLVIKLYKYACRFPKQIWFLNTDDRQLFIDEQIIDQRFTDILDSEGVDTEHFAPQESHSATNFSFIYVGRLLWAKGIGEYVEAARRLHTKYPDAVFKILGGSDALIPKIDVMPEDLQAWKNEGIVTYFGETRNVVPYIGESDCIVLPSYREGVPRTLLEAASMGKPIITTDSIGCRETIIDKQSGLLCQPRDIDDLADKMEQMLTLTPERRHEMGLTGRQLVLDRFDSKIVIERYRQFLQKQFSSAQSAAKPLNVSIVAYNTPDELMKQLVDTLRQSPCVNEIFIVDNSPNPNGQFATLPVRYIFNGKNLGYGRAHNIAMRQTLQTDVPYHLTVNPDVKLDSRILGQLLAFMDSNDDVAALMPKVYYPNGKLQYLCKLLPTPWNLFGRRFLPKRFTRQSQHHFELRDFDYNHIADIPFLSGCFMLLRSSALKNVGVFDERFFMYMEDVDLSRRLYQKFRTVFYPDVTIVHEHAHGSYKSQRLLGIHIVSSCRYFNKWGWFRDKERTAINQTVIEKINQIQKEK